VNVPALQLQAITGLIAILVLVVIMNWFFHKLYWTGWITLHTDRKRRLVKGAEDAETSRARLLWGFSLLGFTSLYREGFEVVLFLQSYRLKLGTGPVGLGVLIGLALTLAVALLTFVGHRRLPYKKMLVVTGVMLGVVLVVMVGEQAQEMQLAHWLSTTTIGWLEALVPAWMGLWFAIFPTVETLAAQALAVLLVLGSYLVASLRSKRTARVRKDDSAEMPERV
jgi:high-affinity iron transporter